MLEEMAMPELPASDPVPVFSPGEARDATSQRPLLDGHPPLRERG